jgi:hypothetical protein
MLLIFVVLVQKAYLPLTQVSHLPLLVNLKLRLSMVTRILLHRGFPIDQLATESNYLEVCYILLNGEKPTRPNMTNSKPPSPATP